MFSRKVNCKDATHRFRIDRTGYVVLAICALFTAFGGFEMQTIHDIAPVLVNEWRSSESILASIYTVALIGLTIGASGISSRANCLDIKMAAAAYGSFTVPTVFFMDAPTKLLDKL
jgi:hypothetical protein